MNKHQKELIINAIEELSEVHEIIHEQLMTGNNDDINNILVECQDLAIRIGNRMEMLEGMNAPGIRFLEEYCEMLYQYSIAIDHLIQDPLQLKEALDKILLKVKYAVENEIKTRYEIVFLPYKASMWDSLESIWIAAKEDERCSCRVIPIPYYDKNPDGSFGNEYFDGDQFPAEVPITHYSEYDLEKNKPDIIYFHNPYDGHNFVTSVHPSYYSSELKKYTNMLVYVPYFVTGDTVPGHLCETVGVFMADKVIVQSETIRDIYIKTYINILGKNQKDKETLTGNINHEFWKVLSNMADEKFLSLGSPKIDKVINTMKDDIDIPEEWKKIIRHHVGRNELDDISDIRIILYNTSITDLLNYKEQGIKKIKSVLQIFQDRKDAVLLWRPHPLNESTMKSMVPRILNEYLSLVETYKREEYGIYDTSSDLHRAIAVADAYYGDAHSSIIQMFGITGKPIMLQNMQINDDIIKEDKYSMGFEDFAFDGEYIWFAAIDHNGLYRINIKTKETEFIGKFPDEEEDGIRLYFSCTFYDNKLIFAPFLAKAGAIFDINTYQFTSIMANNCNETLSNKSGKYSGTVVYKNKVYMLPSAYPAIGFYSISEGNFYCKDEWLEELKRLCKVTDDGFNRRFCVTEGRFIMMPFCNANAVLEFDMEKEQSEIFIIGEEGDSYSGICYDGKYYWLAPRHFGEVIRWDRKSGNYIRCGGYPNSYVKCKYSFMDIVYCSGYIWVFPLSSNMVLKIHPLTGEMHEVTEFNSYFNKSNGKYMKFYWVRTDGLKIYAGATSGNKILTYDPVCNYIEEFYATIPMDISKEMIKKRENNIIFYTNEMNSYLYIENGLSFDRCIKPLLIEQKEIKEGRKRKFKHLFSNVNGTCGQHIHKIILEMCSYVFL